MRITRCPGRRFTVSSRGIYECIRNVCEGKLFFVMEEETWLTYSRSQASLCQVIQNPVHRLHFLWHIFSKQPEEQHDIGQYKEYTAEHNQQDGSFPRLPAPPHGQCFDRHEGDNDGIDNQYREKPMELKISEIQQEQGSRKHGGNPGNIRFAKGRCPAKRKREQYVGGGEAYDTKHKQNSLCLVQSKENISQHGADKGGQHRPGKGAVVFVMYIPIGAGKDETQAGYGF